MSAEIESAVGDLAFAGPIARSSSVRLRAALAERMNPLFLKEVRQSLRGKYFKISMLITLAFTTLAGIVVLGFVIPAYHDDVRHYEGLILFLATFGCTAFGVAGLVPFAAFSSMNAESDENTLELLVLSNLSPFAIVLGKLASSVLQASLMCSIALPFAVVAWNLGGLPPSVIVLGPLGAILGSACFSAIGIALSTLSRTRWVRILLMVLFAFFLLNMAQNVLFFAVMGAAAVFVPGAGGSILPVAEVTAVSTALGFAFLAVAVTFACDMLAHREESGSTPMRRVTSVLALAAAATVVLFCGFAGSPAAGPALFIGLIAIAVPLAWCCTENEFLPIGPRVRPPRPGLRSWIAPLHVAGGGRGALLATVLIGMLACVHTSVCVFRQVGWSLEASQGLLFSLYAWIWLLLPSACFAPFSKSVPVRVLARVTLFLFPWFAWFFGCAVVLLTEGPQASVTNNLANPWGMAERLDRNGMPESLVPWLGLAAIALLAFALNAWRMARGVVEMRRAMRERDEGERAR